MSDQRRLLDVSVETRPGTPEWPGDTPFGCGWTARIAGGSSVNLSSLTMSPHVGTHADAPLHVRDGAPASETLRLEAFVGPALILDVAGPPRDLGEELLERVPATTRRLLLRTRASIARGAFPEDWPAITPRLARELVSRGLWLLGVDAPSVDRRESRTLDVHHALFDAGACVLENLDLADAPLGECSLLALPLRVAGLDAAPVRAVLALTD